MDSLERNRTSVFLASSFTLLELLHSVWLSSCIICIDEMLLRLEKRDELSVA